MSHDKKETATLIVGNPKYINDPKIKRMAEAFYDEITMILEYRGYVVIRDPGEAFTRPSSSSHLWVGHSRGIDRLKHAPKGVRTIALETRDGEKKFSTKDARGSDPLHYQLSEKDRAALEEA